MKRSVAKVSSFLVALGVTLAGCVSAPEPISEEVKRERNAQLQALLDEQEGVDRPLTLSEAMARSIKYNLDHRLKLMEHALARTDLDVARMDLLPPIVADAGWTDRNNENASSSQSITTGRQSLEPSRSSTRDNFTANLELVWNLLDFGVSYVTAQQKSDQVLIAEERRRKAVQNIIRDVRATYWEALNAQRLGPEMDTLLADIESAIEESRRMRDEGLQSRGVAARFQEDLLITLRHLWRIRRDLETSRLELARLMNLKPGTDYTVEPAADELMLPDVDALTEDLEQQALTSLPELREEDYRLRIDQREVKKAMLRMFPGLEIRGGVHYDDNPFLVNEDWSDGAIRVTWNLFNLFAGPAFKREAEANVALDGMRRLALSMAALTQLHVAYQNYHAAKVNYEVATEWSGVNKQIFDQFQARQRARQSNQLLQFRARSRAIVAQLQRDQAFAQLQNSVGRIQASLGMDPLPETVASYDLEILTSAIAARQQELGRLLEAAASEQEVLVEELPQPDAPPAREEVPPPTARVEQTGWAISTP